MQLIGGKPGKKSRPDAARRLILAKRVTKLLRARRGTARKFSVAVYGRAEYADLPAVPEAIDVPEESPRQGSPTEPKKQAASRVSSKSRRGRASESGKEQKKSVPRRTKRRAGAKDRKEADPPSTQMLNRHNRSKEARAKRRPAPTQLEGHAPELQGARVTGRGIRSGITAGRESQAPQEELRPGRMAGQRAVREIVSAAKSAAQIAPQDDEDTAERSFWAASRQISRHTAETVKTVYEAGKTAKTLHELQRPEGRSPREAAEPEDKRGNASQRRSAAQNGPKRPKPVNPREAVRLSQTAEPAVEQNVRSATGQNKTKVSPPGCGTPMTGIAAGAGIPKGGQESFVPLQARGDKAAVQPVSAFPNRPAQVYTHVATQGSPGSNVPRIHPDGQYEGHIHPQCARQPRDAQLPFAESAHAGVPRSGTRKTKKTPRIEETIRAPPERHGAAPGTPVLSRPRKDAHREYSPASPREILEAEAEKPSAKQKPGSFNTLNEQNWKPGYFDRGRTAAAKAIAKRHAAELRNAAPSAEGARHLFAELPGRRPERALSRLRLSAMPVLVAAAILILLTAGMTISMIGAAGGSAQAAGGAAYMDLEVVLAMKRDIGAQWAEMLRAEKDALISQGATRVTVRYNAADTGDGDESARLDNWNDVLAVWLVQNDRVITAQDTPEVRDIYFAMNPISPSLEPGTMEGCIDVHNLRAPDAARLFGIAPSQISRMEQWISPVSGTSAFWAVLLGSSVAPGAEYVPGYLDVAPGSAVQIILQEAQSRAGWIYSQERRTQRGYADCSSLVWACYRAVGIELAGSWPTAAEMARYCDSLSCRVPTDAAAPGDLIFWAGRSNGRYLGVYHVALYAGDGMMWEAAPSAGGVVYRPVSVQSPGNILCYARPLAALQSSWESWSLPEGIAGSCTMVLTTTAYCEACDTIYGDGRTASGTYPKRGTVATSRTRQFPFGTRLYIPGYGYGVVEDTGGFGDGTIDLYLGHRDVCTCGDEWGRKRLTVYVLS